MADRTPRQAETRESASRKKASFKDVNQFQNLEDLMPAGWRYKWVRVSCFDYNDDANVQTHLVLGYEFVKRSEVPGMPDFQKREGATGDHIVNKGLILMKVPEAIHQELMESPADEATAQIEGVKQALGRDQHPSMPMRFRL